MDVFIYFSERLEIGLDEIEDHLEEALDGLGEATGAGSGELGSNIDLEIDDKTNVDQLLKLICDALISLKAPLSTVIEIEGREYKLVD